MPHKHYGLLFGLAVLVGAVGAGCGGCEPDGQPSLPAQSDGVSAVPPSTPVQREIVSLPVTWPSTLPDQATRAILAPEFLSEISNSSVPVLVPTDKSLLLANTFLRAFPEGYVFSHNTDDFTLRVEGSAIAYRYSGTTPSSPTTKVRDLPGWRLGGEGQTGLAWEENGAYYLVKLTCSRLSDTRCATMGFALSLTNTLAYVGGRGH